MSEMKTLLAIMEGHWLFGGGDEEPVIQYRVMDTDSGEMLESFFDEVEAYDYAGKMNDREGRKRFTVDPIAESAVVEAFDDGDDNSEVLQDLEDAYEEMLVMVDKLDNIVRRLPEPHASRARSYWLGHIKSSVNSAEYGYGGYDTDMARTINDLERGDDF